MGYDKINPYSAGSCQNGCGHCVRNVRNAQKRSDWNYQKHCFDRFLSLGEQNYKDCYELCLKETPSKGTALAVSIGMEYKVDSLQFFGHFMVLFFFFFFLINI